MSELVQGPAELNIEIPRGDDFALTVTVTENSVAYVWTGATVATAIYNGGGVESATDFTVATPSAGTLTLTLTDADTTALGPGLHRYAVSVTKDGSTHTWLAGVLRVTEPTRPPASTNAAASLAITTAPSVELSLELGAGALTTAGALLTLLKTVDGAGSGLDAGLLGGYSPGAFAKLAEANELTASNTFTIGDGETVVIRDTAGNTVATFHPNGHIIFGSDDGIVYAEDGDIDGGLNQPDAALIVKSFHLDAETVRRLFTASITMHETNELPEFVMRRSVGNFYTQEKGQGFLAVDIPDITALNDTPGLDTITLTEMGTTGAGWTGQFGGNPGGYRTALIQQSSKQALIEYDSVDFDNKQLLGVRYIAGSAVGSTAYTASDTTYVTRISTSGASAGTWFAQVWMGRGGWQTRLCSINMAADEDQYPDGYGAFYGGGALTLSTTGLGPKSERHERVTINAKGQVLLVGGWNEAFDTGALDRHWTVGGPGTVADHTDDVSTIPTPSSTAFWLQVEDMWGFPATGYLSVLTSASGSVPAIIGYTSYGVGDGVTVAAHGEVSSPGRHYFKGCTVGFAVTNKALTSNVATLTTSAAHSFEVGQTVTVAGVDATFNGTYTIVSVPTTTTFTYAKVAGDVASTAATGSVVFGSVAFAGATIAHNEKVRVAKVTLADDNPIAGYRGNVVVYDFSDNDARTELGAIGPSFWAPQGGIWVGRVNSGPVSLYRYTDNTWALGEDNKLGFATGPTQIDVLLKPLATSLLGVRNRTDTADGEMQAAVYRTTNYIRLEEVADPGAATANGMRLFGVDSGAGDGVLKVRFASGVAKTIVQQAPFALTDGAGVTTDASKGPIFTLTLGNNRTMNAPNNPSDGQIIRYSIKGAFTVAWNAVFNFGSSFTAPAGAYNATRPTILSFMYDLPNTEWRCIGIAAP